MVAEVENLFDTIGKKINKKNGCAPVVCVFGDHDMETNEKDIEENRRKNSKKRSFKEIPYQINTGNLSKILKKFSGKVWSGYTTDDIVKIKQVRMPKGLAATTDDEKKSTRRKKKATEIDSRGGLAAATTLWDSSPTKHIGIALSDSVIPYEVDGKHRIRSGDMNKDVAQELSSLIVKAFEELTTIKDSELSFMITFQHHPFTINSKISSMFGPRVDYDFGKGADPYNRDLVSDDEIDTLNPGQNIMIHGHVHYSHVTPDLKANRINIGVPPLGDKAYDDDHYGFLNLQFVHLNENKYMLFISKYNYDGRKNLLERMLAPSRVLIMTFKTENNGQISKIDKDILSLKTRKTKKRHLDPDVYFVNSVDRYDCMEGENIFYC